MLENLSRGGIHGKAGAVHNQQPVCQSGHILHGVADHEHRRILSCPIGPDVAQDLLPAHRVQPGRWLVQNEHFRLHGDNAGDGNSALLPAGQVEGRNLQLLFRQAHKARSLPDPTIDFFLGKAHIGWSEGDVLIDRLFKELILGILEDQPHPEPGGSCKLLIGPDVLAVQQHPAGGGL